MVDPQDVISYQSVGIPTSRIYIINPAGQVAFASQTVGTKTYLKINDIVEHMFPPVVKVDTTFQEYNDFSFWGTSSTRMTVDLADLEKEIQRDAASTIDGNNNNNNLQGGGKPKSSKS